MNAEQAKRLSRDEFHRYAAGLRPETRMVIDGELVEARSGATFETVNPATGSVIARLPQGDAAEVDLAVAAARRAFKSGVWSRLEPRARMQVLYRFAQAIDEHTLEFALLDSLDVGKPVMDMITGDVPAAALTFQYFAETIDKVEGTVTTTASDAFHYILRQPLGVVGCITPWNYPLLMTAWKVAPALAVGNSVVLKPAQQSPLSAVLLARLFLEAGGPPGVFNVVHGTGGTAGKALALHMDVDKISFTGSTEIGKLMMVYAGQSNLKRVTVETGGKSPQIITAETPDLDRAVDYAITGIYANKGEMCSAGSRLLVRKHDPRRICRSLRRARRKAPFASATRSTRRRRWGRSSTAPSSSACSAISTGGARRGRASRSAAAPRRALTRAPMSSRPSLPGSPRR